MMGRTHATTGAIAWVAIAPSVVSPQMVMIGIPLAAVAALGPDIDHGGSLLGKALPFISWPIRKARWLTGGHRGATHSALAILAVYVLCLPFGDAVAAAVTIGYGSHIAGDMMTVDGCALAWPVSGEKVPGLAPMRTGSRWEYVFIGLSAVAGAISLLWRAVT